MGGLREFTRRSGGWLGVLAAVCVLGSAFQRVQIDPLSIPDVLVTWVRTAVGGGIALVDPLIGITALLTVPLLLDRRSPAWALLDKALVWIGLYVAAELLGLIGVGIAGWAVDALVRDLFVFGAFFTFLALYCARADAARRSYQALTATATIVVVTLLFHGDTQLFTGRAIGTFTNPNYAAHFVATVLVLLVLGPLRRRTKLVLGIPLVAALAVTGSFGGILLVAAALTYAGWKRLPGALTRLRRSIGGAAVIGLAIVSAALLVTGIAVVIVDGFDLGHDITDARLERSYHDRTQFWSNAVDLWVDHPLGVGPEGFLHRPDLHRPDANEIHNDALAVLLEGGPLALIGLIGLCWVLWKAGDPGGTARALLVGFAAASLVRETINFRHLWLILALALAAELRDRPGAASGSVQLVPARGDGRLPEDQR